VGEGEEAAAPEPAVEKKATSVPVAIVLALISAAAAIAVAAINKCTSEPHAPPPNVAASAKRERAETAFGQLEGAVVRYVGAADDFGNIFVRRGRAAFTSKVAQQEIDQRGIQLSAAYHELSEEGPRHIRDLEAALPERVALAQDATELLNYILRELHQSGVRRLNRVIDVINDSDGVGRQSRSKLIDDNMVQVATTAEIIQKEALRSTEKLNTLRRSFGAAIADL
jgi:hypothetical protein